MLLVTQLCNFDNPKYLFLQIAYSLEEDYLVCHYCFLGRYSQVVSISILCQKIALYSTYNCQLYVKDIRLNIIKGLIRIIWSINFELVLKISVV